jgi:hypothetical protein
VSESLTLYAFKSRLRRRDVGLGNPVNNQRVGGTQILFGYDGVRWKGEVEGEGTS